MTKESINKNGAKHSQTTTLINTEVESHSNREQHKLISLQSLDLSKYLVSEPSHSQQQNGDQEPTLIDINLISGTMAPSFPFLVNIDIHETEIGATDKRKEIPKVLFCNQEVLDEHHCNHISSCLLQNEPSIIVNNPVVEKSKSDSDSNEAKQQQTTTANKCAILVKETKTLSSPPLKEKCNRAFIERDILGKKPIDEKTNLSETLSIEVDQIEIDLLYTDDNIQNMSKTEEDSNIGHFPSLAKSCKDEELDGNILEDSTDLTEPVSKTLYCQEKVESSTFSKSINREKMENFRFAGTERTLQSNQSGVQGRNNYIVRSQSQKNSKISNYINCKGTHPSKESPINKFDPSSEFPSEKYNRNLPTKNDQKCLIKCNSLKESMCKEETFPLLDWSQNEILASKMIQEKVVVTSSNISVYNNVPFLIEHCLEMKTEIEDKNNSEKKDSNTFVTANNTSVDLQGHSKKQIEFEDFSVAKEKRKEVALKQQQQEQEQEHQQPPVNNEERPPKSAANMTKEANQTR